MRRRQRSAPRRSGRGRYTPPPPSAAIAATFLASRRGPQDHAHQRPGESTVVLPCIECRMGITFHTPGALCEVGERGCWATGHKEPRSGSSLYLIMQDEAFLRLVWPLAGMRRTTFAAMLRPVTLAANPLHPCGTWRVLWTASGDRAGPRGGRARVWDLTASAQCGYICLPAVSRVGSPERCI